ncbi:MAG TPA: glycerol-3-phosphate dehydrogenase, partial [Arthrobacter sp.]
SAVPVVAKLMGEVLGWSDVQRESEIKHYIARVEAERLSQQQPDDESADAARMGVDNIVPLR